MAESSKAKNIALWVVTALVGLMFVVTGGGKIFNPAATAEVFAHWGYPAWFGVLTGIIELACGLLLFVPRFAAYAAGLLVAVMIGATFTHIRAGEMEHLWPPLALMALSAIIAFLRRPSAKSI